MEEKILDLLSKILDELSLLSITAKAQYQEMFYKDFLSGGNRRAMYELIDGISDLQLISDTLGCSLRATQIFIKELIEKNLIDVEKRGNATIPKKSIIKIALYYSSKKLIMEGE